jgi:hypothetical protein
MDGFMLSSFENFSSKVRAVAWFDLRHSDRGRKEDSFLGMNREVPQVEAITQI